LPVSPKLAKISETKALQKQIEEIRREEQILIEITQPWRDEALQLLQEVDGKLLELQQKE